MEFIIEHYLWFLAGIIILLMTLIGYIADKTDFGRKDADAGKPTKGQDEVIPVVPVVDIPAVEVEPTVELSLSEPLEAESKIELPNEELSLMEPGEATNSDLEEPMEVGKITDIVEDPIVFSEDPDAYVYQVEEESELESDELPSLEQTMELLTPISVAEMLNEEPVDEPFSVEIKPVAEIDPIGEDTTLEEEVQTSDLDNDIWRF